MYRNSAGSSIAFYRWNLNINIEPLNSFALTQYLGTLNAEGI
jgi:hypothetical protein